MPVTYDKIATTTLTTTTANVTFSSISGSYTDLVLITNLFTTSGGNGLGIQFNGDTGSNYSFTYITGNGSSASSGRASNQTNGQIDRIATSSVGVTNIMNYSNTTTNKTVLSRGNTNAEVFAWVDLWRSTAAITSIKLFPNDGTNLSSGSTFTLYGIKAFA